MATSILPIIYDVIIIISTNETFLKDFIEKFTFEFLEMIFWYINQSANSNPQP